MIDGATYRRILDEALTAQIERRQAKIRELLHLADRKQSADLFDLASEEQRLVNAAEQIREAVREEAG